MRWTDVVVLTVFSTGAACSVRARPVAEALEGTCGRRLPNTGKAADLPLKVVTVKDAEGRCNDGTPPKMYVQHGTPAHADDWVLSFEGGAFCKDYTSCMTRWCGIGPYNATRMSTKFDAPSMSVGGMLSDRADNEFRDWNVVRLRYCTSDDWTGDTKEPEELRGLFNAFTLGFEGRQVLDDLLGRLDRGATSDDGSESLPKLTRASRIVVVGESAGAIGALHHVDRIAQRYDRAKVWGIVDGGTEPWPEVFDTEQQRVASREHTAEFRRDVYEGLWHAKSDRDCKEEMCFRADTLIPGGVISTPLAIRQDELDPVYLAYYSKVDADPAAYAGAVAKTLRAFAARRSEDVSYFGPRCGEHISSGNDLYFTLEASDQGRTMTWQQIVEDLVLHGKTHTVVQDPGGQKLQCGSGGDARRRGR